MCACDVEISSIRCGATIHARTHQHSCTHTHTHTHSHVICWSHLDKYTYTHICIHMRSHTLVLLQRSNKHLVYWHRNTQIHACKQTQDSGRPLLPPKKYERDILESCNKNLYEKAIILIEMSRLPRLSAERHKLLSEAMSALMEAESAEQKIEQQVCMYVCMWGFCMY